MVAPECARVDVTWGGDPLITVRHDGLNLREIYVARAEARSTDFNRTAQVSRKVPVEVGVSQLEIAVTDEGVWLLGLDNDDTLWLQPLSDEASRAGRGQGCGASGRRRAR